MWRPQSRYTVSRIECRIKFLQNQRCRAKIALHPPKSSCRTFLCQGEGEWCCGGLVGGITALLGSEDGSHYRGGVAATVTPVAPHCATKPLFGRYPEQQLNSDWISETIQRGRVPMRSLPRKKLFKTRDLELPIFEGSLPICLPHSAGYTCTFVHRYFPVAKPWAILYFSVNVFPFLAFWGSPTILFDIITFLIRKFPFLCNCNCNFRKIIPRTIFYVTAPNCNCKEIFPSDPQNCNCNGT